MSERPIAGRSASLGARILTLLFLVRSTGNAMYRQEIGLNETGLRLVSVLGRAGPQTHTQLVGASGYGKPQVSRGTRELIAAGLVDHRNHRAPFELTEQGAATYQQLAALADLRSDRIMAGTTADDVAFLSGTIMRLVRLGESWLLEEQSLSAGGPPLDEPPISAAAGDEAAGNGLVSSLITMAVLMQRSAFLRWRRTAGISPVNWVVLSRIAEHGQLVLTRLAYLTARDKSQVWRTVTRMAEEGLVERIEQSGTREVAFSVTERGQEIYRLTADDAAQRDRTVATLLGPVERARFEYLVELMIANTQQMLARGGAA